MWKLFTLLSVIAAFRFWKVDHGIIAGLSIFVGIMVFWSAGVMDNIARADNNLTGPPRSQQEELWVGLNLISSLAAIGLFIGCFFA